MAVGLELSFSVDNDVFEFSAATRPEDLADQLKLIATKLEYPGWHAASVVRAKALASAPNMTVMLCRR